MAKITSVIDIGSNSCTMVVYRKSSRYAFNIIKEVKSKVILSEGSFTSGYLQDDAINRTIKVLKEFVQISKQLKARKILTIATSAVRDAKNSKQFLKEIKNRVGINVKIIQGEQEAKLGAIASINLIDLDNYMSVDIGGGSTELSIIKNKKNIKNISLDIGTIRLKEMFLQTKSSSNDSMIEYIDSILDSIEDNFLIDDIVAIGGTLRAFSRVVMGQSKYPLDIVHGFKYDAQDASISIDKLLTLNQEELKGIGVKFDRINTFKEGILIFQRIIKKVQAKTVVSSSVGIREGAYLKDLLRNNNYIFPQNFNLSIRNISDRFIYETKEANFNKKIAKELFELLYPIHQLDEKYSNIVQNATKLSRVGSMVNYYNRNINNFYFLLYGLNFGYTHHDRLLTALLSGYKANKNSYKDIYKKYKTILPPIKTIDCLSNIVILAKAINTTLNNQNYLFNLTNNKLTITHYQFSKLTDEYIKKIEEALKEKEKEILSV